MPTYAACYMLLNAENTCCNNQPDILYYIPSVVDEEEGGQKCLLLGQCFANCFEIRSSSTMKRFFKKKNKKSKKKGEEWQSRPLSMIPNERDRKALLGCWATILATSNAHYAQTSSDHDTIILSSKKEQVQAELYQHLRRRYRFHCDLLLSAGQALELPMEYVTGLLPLLEHLRAVSVDEHETRKAEEKQETKDEPDRSHEIRALQGVKRVMDASKPFLEDMAYGAAFRCVAILLMKSILNASYGYDARYRSDIKRLAIIVFLYHQSSGGDFALRSVEQASDLFHQLEHSIGSKLLLLALVRKVQNDEADAAYKEKDNVLRGIQVGAAGVVAGTLLAVTGGLAAPAIAAGVAGVVGTSLATSTIVLSLTTTTAITTIFGVGGGAYVAHKMHRRTEGLTEFDLEKEFQGEPVLYHAELFSTIAISGWIRDQSDFQRPWGVQPTKPPIARRRELVERFYTVHNPARVKHCEHILREWKDYENYLWAHLKWKYGSDPDDPFSGRSPKPPLSDEHSDIVEGLFVHFQLCTSKDAFEAQRQQEKQLIQSKDHWKRDGSKNDDEEQNLGIEVQIMESPSDGMEVVISHQETDETSDIRRRSKPNNLEEGSGVNLIDSMHGPKRDKLNIQNLVAALPFVDFVPKAKHQQEIAIQTVEEEIIQGSEIKGVWDFRSRYYGELYTVRFEGELMQDFCNYVRTMVAEEAAKHVGGHALKFTILHALMSAVAIPAVMLKMSDLIDEKLTMVLERADAAGVELAKSLLDSRDAGQRPVVLVGYSFGARIIFSCLKELARCQMEWEKQVKSHKETKIRREPASVVEDAILIGLPRNISSSFHLVRQVVAGRFVNCYSTKDWFLLLMWQTRQATGLKFNNMKRPVAGASAIDIPGIENIDVSDLVEVQADYCDAQDEILERVRMGHPAY